MKTKNMTTEEKLKKVIQAIAADPKLIAYIKEIEKKPETTKGHYGEYMRFISDFPQSMRKIIAAGLMQAGADIEGVQGAMLILTQ